MLRPRCNIVIEGDNKVIFEFCQSLEVKTSFDSFIDTAEVTLPNKINKDNIEIIDLIKRGDKITIDLGHQTNTDTNLNNVFKRSTRKRKPDYISGLGWYNPQLIGIFNFSFFCLV